jgi:type I restriction enzyme S subunit
MLPKGWKRSTVGESCSIRNQFRFPISAQQRALMRGDYPYYGPTGVLGYLNHYRIDEEIALIGEDGDHFLKSRDREMTLFVAGRSSVNNHAHVIGNSKRCLAKWFYYWFMHRDITPVLSRQGVGRYKLTKAGLEKLEIWLPPLQEQERIVGLLDTWDEAITAMEKLFANSRTQKQALVQRQFSALTPKHRACEIFKPHSVRRNGGLELLSVMQGAGVIPRRLLDRKVVMPDGSTDAYKLVEPGDFVISLRSFEGGLEYSRHTGLVSPAYTVLKPRMEICDDYYRHYFKSREFIGRLAVAVIGIRDGKQVSYEDFSFLKLPYPAIAEQERVAAILNQAEASVAGLERQVESLRAEKRALMQQLLTGKRRVHLNAADTKAAA